MSYNSLSSPFLLRPNYNFGLGKRADDSLEDYESYDVLPMRYAYVDDNQYDSEWGTVIIILS